jgi:hypothetical protein
VVTPVKKSKSSAKLTKSEEPPPKPCWALEDDEDSPNEEGEEEEQNEGDEEESLDGDEVAADPHTRRTFQEAQGCRAGEGKSCSA